MGAPSKVEDNAGSRPLGRRGDCSMEKSSSRGRIVVSAAASAAPRDPPRSVTRDGRQVIQSSDKTDRLVVRDFGCFRSDTTLDALEATDFVFV